MFVLFQFYVYLFLFYCQKVLVVFYENGMLFELCMLEDLQVQVELVECWLIKCFLVLVDGEWMILEVICIIEYLDWYYFGLSCLLLDNVDDVLEVCMFDCFFDNYIFMLQQKVVFDCI